MPLVLGDSRNVDENVIPRAMAEMRRPLNDEVNDFRRQQDSRRHVSFAAIYHLIGDQSHAVEQLPSIRTHPNKSNDTFDDEDEAGDDEPLPEVRTVERDQKPERNVQQVSPVEDLEAATTTNEWK